MHYRRYRRHGDVNYITPEWRAGRGNPNCRHPNLNDSYLAAIDSPDKAYLLGWIASDGHVNHDSVVITVHAKDRQILSSLAALVGHNGPRLIKSKKVMWGLSLNSTQLAHDAARHLGLPVDVKKDAIVEPLQTTDSNLKWAFMRGFFDGDGSVRLPSGTRTPECNVASYSPYIREFFIQNSAGAKDDPKNKQVRWTGVAALDFLGKLYADTTFPYLSRKRDIFVDWSLWVPVLTKGFCISSRGLMYSTTDAAALPLIKHNASDSGYDVAVIKEVRKLGNVTLYGTGIKVSPPFGYYFDLLPRSSIIKTGYMLANSVGVIDRSYVGEILVALIKTNPDAPDLALPARVVQLVPRPIVNLEIVQVTELSDSERGEAGFGSTGR